MLTNILTNEQEIAVAKIISNFLKVIGMKSLAFVSLHMAPRTLKSDSGIDHDLDPLLMLLVYGIARLLGIQGNIDGHNRTTECHALWKTIFQNMPLLLRLFGLLPGPIPVRRHGVVGHSFCVRDETFVSAMQFVIDRQFSQQSPQLVVGVDVYVAARDLSVSFENDGRLFILAIWIEHTKQLGTIPGGLDYAQRVK